MPGILVRAHVIPRPAVESTLLHRADVVGHEIVAQFIPLIYRAPQLPRCRIYSDAHRITDAVRIHFDELAVRGELENIGAMKFVRVRVWVVHVRSRTDRDEKLRAIERKGEIARPVSTAGR